MAPSVTGPKMRKDEEDGAEGLLDARENVFYIFDEQKSTLVSASLSRPQI